jgi:starvation-inducible DNA-binding protein
MTVHPGLTQKFGTLDHAAIGLSEGVRADLVQALNRDLANLLLLYLRYKKEHWTVRGPHFKELHELFEEHAVQVLEATDVVAERIRGLGGVPVAMPDEIAEHATIGQLPAGIFEPKIQLAETLNGLENIIVELRADMGRADQHGDPTTNDLLNTILDTLEKQSWFIQSHLSPSLIGSQG